MQHAVDAETDDADIAPGLDVDVAGALLDRTVENGVYVPDDRCLIRRIPADEVFREGEVVLVVVLVLKEISREIEFGGDFGSFWLARFLR